MSAEEVLYIEAGSNKSSLLSERPLSEGIFGKKLEDALQRLLADHPDLLPGAQIAPGAEEPPRFFLLRRETSIGSMSLDHLFIDQFGVLTLVECKLFQNQEQRRLVIGQIVEYLANAESRWSSASLRLTAAEKRGVSVEGLDSLLAQRLFEGAVNIEDFWADVDRKLKRRELRVIIAADRLNPNVRTLIEFLNSEFSTIEVLGLEITCYGNDGDEEDSLRGYVVVPRVIGQTQASSQKASSASEKRRWEPELLEAAFEERPEPLRTRLMDLKKLATDAGRFSTSVSIVPMFSFRTASKRVVLQVHATGSAYFTLHEAAFASAEHREKWSEVLRDLRLIASDAEIQDVVDGRNSVRSIQDLSEDEYARFRSGIEEHILKDV